MICSNALLLHQSSHTCSDSKTILCVTANNFQYGEYVPTVLMMFTFLLSYLQPFCHSLCKLSTLRTTPPPTITAPSLTLFLAHHYFSPQGNCPSLPLSLALSQAGLPSDIPGLTLPMRSLIFGSSPNDQRYANSGLGK